VALEAAGAAGEVIFDKTGTLTVGKPRVTAVEAAPARTERDVLRLAAAAEHTSEHPIARAIVAAATERGLHVPAATRFQAIAGQGVRADAEGRLIEVLRDPEGRSTCVVMIDGVRAGTITVADQPRDDARSAIQRLRAMGVSVTMLSGDRRASAEDIGRQIGLRSEEIVAPATPDEKVAHVERRRRARGESAASGSVIMVGDGINDAAALAAADLGIAMASGTNIAIESADVVIPGEHVAAVASTIDLSRQTLRTIRQNLFFAFFYNAAAIPAAAFGLLGPYGPLIAAMAMGLSDITVVGNALRLKARLARRL
jgi:P-type E1-E2 ATPase